MTITARSCGFQMDMWSKLCSRNRVSRSRWRFPNLWQERFKTFMSSSINTACKSHNVRRMIVILALLGFAAVTFAQDIALHPPSGAIAGQATSISTGGSGSATFYLIGPSGTVKRDVQLGGEIALGAGELRASGRYVVVVCSGSCSSGSFFVSPA